LPVTRDAVPHDEAGNINLITGHNSKQARPRAVAVDQIGPEFPETGHQVLHVAWLRRFLRPGNGGQATDYRHRYSVTPAALREITWSIDRYRHVGSARFLRDGQILQLFFCAKSAAVSGGHVGYPH
jgi:hypothetical protein